ncbi:M24 family metallopeptidase [Streptococcus dentasini]
MSKLTHIRNYLVQNQSRLAIISDPVTVKYLTGFECDPHERQLFLFIYSDQEPILFLPELEVARARQTVKFEVIGYNDAENPWQKIRLSLPRIDSNIIYIEFDHLNVTKFNGLQSVFLGRFDNITPLIQEMRLIKSPEELNKLLVAGVYADYAVKVGFDNIRAGRTEMDLVAQIEYELKKKGIRQVSFDTLVLTGNNAANPHGISGTNRIQNDALLLFDLGVVCEGYTSDISRTVAIGRPDQFKEDIYKICLEAQLTAQEVIKPGVTAGEVDAAARRVIEKAGYGDYFNHRLGHGLGIEVHEYPSIMAGSDLVLQEGMCFSVEPGIYIPGRVGVRIEDCGSVGKDGFQPFTQTPKKLQYFDL